MKKPKNEKEIEEVSFNVDKDRLDEEWVGQPDFYHFWALELANARLALENAKNQLDVVKAELDRDVRSSPEDFELGEKVTETMVANTILLQPAYQDALRKVINAKHKVDVTQAAVNALDHKKKALENLVYLNGQNYFASPRADVADADKMRKGAKKKLHREMQESYDEED